MTTKSVNPQLKKYISPIIISALLVVFILLFIPSNIIPISWDFRNNLWGPSNLLVHQRSPYNIQVIFNSSNAVWMPVVIGSLFPIGLLPLQWASNLWLLLNLSSLSMLVLILARNGRASIISILLTVFSIAIFPSTISNLVLGQISLIICFILLILLKYRYQLTPITSGLFLAFCFTKPQLIILFFPAYLVLYYREQRRNFLKLILFQIFWIVILCIPLFILFPAWIPDFLGNLTANPSWSYPSLFSFLQSNSISYGMSLFLSGIYLIIGVGIAIYLTFKYDGSEALIWCLAITTLFSPVIWSWDFVLIYPLFIFMVFQKKSIFNSWVLYLGFGICTIAYLFMKIFGFVDDQMTIWIPPFIIAALCMCRLFLNKLPTGVASNSN
jgi:hypothetical protein